MRSEREEIEEIKVFYRLTCDWCGEKTPESEDYDALPEGWIEQQFEPDWDTIFSKIPAWGIPTGTYGVVHSRHFDSQEHLDLWEKQSSHYKRSL